MITRLVIAVFLLVAAPVGLCKSLETFRLVDFSLNGAQALDARLNSTLIQLETPGADDEERRPQRKPGQSRPARDERARGSDGRTPAARHEPASLLQNATPDDPWISMLFGIRAGIQANITPFYSWVPGPVVNYELWLNAFRFGNHRFWWEIYGESSFNTGIVDETADDIFPEEGDDPGRATTFSQEFGLNLAISITRPRSLVSGITPMIFGGAGIMVEWNRYQWDDSVRVGGTFIPRGQRTVSTTRGALALNIGAGLYGNWWMTRFDTTTNLGSQAAVFELSLTLGIYFGS